MPINRKRTLYFFLIIGVIGIGLASRSKWVPELIYAYLGDILYALMIYLIVGFLFPRLSSVKVALTSVAICYSIEISQLCQAEWLVELRKNRLGRLILGRGFLWSDLFCYLIGALAGIGLEYFGPAFLHIHKPVSPPEH